MLSLIATSAPQGGFSGAYLVVTIGAAIAAIFGGGGIIALFKAVGTSAVRSDRHDKSSDIVLGSEAKKIEPLASVIEARFEARLQVQDSALALQGRQLEALSMKIEELTRKVTPNGGNTSDIGDVVARLENRVTELVEQLRGGTHTSAAP